MVTLIRALHAAAGQGLEHVLAELDRVAPELTLQPGDAEVLRYVARLTLAPRTMTPAHLDPLRAAGLDDLAIHDVVHVVGCFSYMNRLADGLGVHLDPHMRAWAETLFGPEALARHDAWASPATT